MFSAVTGLQLVREGDGVNAGYQT